MTRLRLGILLVAVAAGGAECSKPGWVSELEARMDVAVPELEAALDALSAALGVHADELDRRTLARVQALDRALRDSVEGLALVLAERRDALDADLLARAEQLRDAARRLTGQVEAAAARTEASITLTVDELLATAGHGVDRVLLALDIGIDRVERVGDLEVARIHRFVDVQLVRAGALVLLAVLALVGGGWLVWQVRQQRPLRLGWVPGVALLGLLGLAFFLLVEPEAFPGTGTETIVIGRDAGCPAALAEAARALRPTDGSGQAGALARVVPGLLRCQALSSDPAMLERARDRLDGIRRALGVELGCVRDDDCPAGHRCEVELGTCSDACRRDPDCPAGEVCHPEGRRCGPPCRGDHDCGVGRCREDGRCAPRRYRLESGAIWRILGPAR